MRKIVLCLLILTNIIAKAQNRVEVGVDLSLMKVNTNYFSVNNEKINSRFGANIGLRCTPKYTFRIGLYRENWDFRNNNKICTTDTTIKYQLCYNNNFDYMQSWWSIPLINEIYLWKRTIKIIATPNILFNNGAYDVALMGGVGYDWAFSDYGYIKIEALYQSNKFDFFGRKNKVYSNIWLLNVGIQYLI